MSRIKKLENIYKERLANHNINDVSVFIQSVVDADITKGKYARFLIDCFLNDKFLEEDLSGGLDSTVGHAISLFHKHKSKLPENMRSVFKYNSPGDLWNSVKQYQGELSGKELKKEEQEKIYRETEFIYKDEETGFQIISPLTEESAKWWGKGTRWCTSADNNNRFEYYAKKAPLLLLLMPASASTAGNDEKLQLWKYDNYIQFMDEADNEIELEYIKQNWKLLEPICLWLNNLKYIPDELRTKELCESAVKQNGIALQYVPKVLKTPELCNLAVQQNGLALLYVPEKLRTKKLCKIAVQNNGEALEYVLNTFFKRYKDYNMCKLAVEQNGVALRYVPEKYINHNLCMEAIKNDGYSLCYISEELRTKELCQLAVKQNGEALQFVPDKYINYNLCLEAIKQNGCAIGYIPKAILTLELCQIAVSNNGRALNYISKNFRTKEICRMAVQQDGLALYDVPKENITKELCEFAVKQDEKALWYVPDEFKKELQHVKKKYLNCQWIDIKRCYKK